MIGFFRWLWGLLAGPAVRPPAPPPPHPPRPAGGDPTGVVAEVNRARIAHGLRALAVDGILAAQAAANNSAQQRHGIGHHIVPLRCAQCVDEGQPDAASVVAAWLNDVPHREIVLDGWTTQAGGAFDGTYWTLNVTNRREAMSWNGG
jgi:uncharacterized protein YkwD